MPYIKTIVSCALLVVTGMLTHSWLTGVSDNDIYAYHKLDFRTGNRDLSPGSIAAVSKSGEISEICSLKTEGLAINAVESSVYFNVLKEDFPSYVRSLEIFIRLFGDAEPQSAALDTVFAAKDVPTSGRKFTGKQFVIKDLSLATQFEEPDCQARMAWHLSNGYRVCTVRRSLYSVVLDNSGAILRGQTVAVAFAEHSNFVGETTFRNAGLPYNDLAKSANGQPCDGDSLSWTSKLRRSLQIIDRVELAGSSET